MNRTDAVILSGICYDTFLEWLKNKSEFAESIKKAEVKAKQTMISVIRKSASGYRFKNMDGKIRDVAPVWQAAAWFLERRYKDEFALKTGSIEYLNIEVKKSIIKLPDGQEVEI